MTAAPRRWAGYYRFEVDPLTGMWLDNDMTTTPDTEARADELERKADLLRMALLAPSMREDALRAEAAALRTER